MAHFCKLPSTQPLWQFSMPLGETWEMGLWGIDGNTGNLKPTLPNENVVYAYPPLFAASNGILKFALKAVGMGTVEMLGRNEKGGDWTKSIITVTAPTMPPDQGPEEELLPADVDYKVYPNYIDNVESGTYDPDSNLFLVKHADGTSVSLNYSLILSGVRGSKSPTTGPNVVVGLTGFILSRKIHKILPLQYSEASTPNLAAMVLEVEDVIANNANLAKAAIAFLTIVKTYALAGSAMRNAAPKWKAAPAARAGTVAGEATTAFKAIPNGQSPQSLGRVIASRVVEGSQMAKAAAAKGIAVSPPSSWINRILAAVRPLGLSPQQSAEVIESATISAGFKHGPRALIEGQTIVVTSARTGANNFIIAIRPDGTILRGEATIEVGVHLGNAARVTNVVFE